MQTYNQFIASKKLNISHFGFDVSESEMNPKLFDFQKAVVKWAVKKGKSAIFADCGLGKTAMQLEWANLINKKEKKPILVLAPLAVSKQTIGEGKKFDIETNIISCNEDIKQGINIINYEKLHKIDASQFIGVVLDECFSPDTPIDVFNIDNVLEKRYIKDIQIGDKIFNANNQDYVHKIYKRKINRAIQINVDGRKITSSENHPYFTLHGWKCAQDIQAGDYILATETAVQLLRNDFSAKICGTKNAEILREILLSEMENESSRAFCESSQFRSSEKERVSKIQMVQKRKSESIKRDRTNNQSQSNEQSRNKKKNFIYIAEDKAQTFRAWGKWSRNDIATANNEGCIIRKLDSGICYITGETNTKFSNLLQSRLMQSRLKNSYRNRRYEPLQQEINRQKKGQKIGFIRVDSIKILEQGHPELEKYRDAKGNIYFYDIKATRHPSYSINGLLVHNSSILKSFTGKMRNQIIDEFAHTPYKLACTATPSPNDFMELGNHCEFLNVMTRTEMLSMFFINDASDTGTWKLKGHAEDDFWQFIGSWAAMFSNPSDIGFDGSTFILPELKVHKIILSSDKTQNDRLFDLPAEGLDEIRKARRNSLEIRVAKTKEIVETNDGQFLIWCDFNNESEQLTASISESVEVKGSDESEHKENAMIDFANGKIETLITKPSIAGFGMNWQNCSNMIFCGLSFSYEQYYQAIRRCWRFGQTKEVNVYIIISDKEQSVLDNIERKRKQHLKLNDNIINNVKQYFSFTTFEKIYMTKTIKNENYTAYLGDCVEQVKNLANESIDYSIFSPPFSSLYTYSNSERDMGNCKNDKEFYEHFIYLISELYRVIKSGRLLSFHCMLLPKSKFKDGEIGLKDFRGDLIRMFCDKGFIFHSEVVIWKDPVVAMQRTKALGLLYKQLKKDSVKSRQGIPDYLITMRKPGLNLNPVTKKPEHFSVDMWQKFASPVWMDINQSDTLQRTSAREEKDEKHICPLQLEVIKRALYLWTNPDDVVLSPFAGIGSEGYVSLKTGRKFIGIELKESYYNQMLKNLEVADGMKKQKTLL